MNTKGQAQCFGLQANNEECAPCGTLEGGLPRAVWPPSRALEEDCPLPGSLTNIYRPRPSASPCVRCGHTEGQGTVLVEGLVLEAEESNKQVKKQDSSGCAECGLGRTLELRTEGGANCPGPRAQQGQKGTSNRMSGGSDLGRLSSGSFWKKPAF